MFQTHYHTLQYPETKEKKIWTKDKIEPQHIYWRKLIEIFVTNWDRLNKYKSKQTGKNTRIIAGFVEKSYGVFRHTQRNFEFWIFYPSNPCKIAKKKFRKPEHRFYKLKDILGKNNFIFSLFLRAAGIRKGSWSLSTDILKSSFPFSLKRTSFLTLLIPFVIYWNSSKCICTFAIPARIKVDTNAHNPSFGNFFRLLGITLAEHVEENVTFY